MKRHWENFTGKVNGMSLRERVLIFAAAAFILVALAKTFFLDPLLSEQKKISAKVQQQQAQMKVLQAQMDTSTQARRDVENSPLHKRIEQAAQKLAEGDAYLQGRRERLVEPEKMVDLLEQLVLQNGHLQLVNLHTLPVVPLTKAKPGATTVLDKQLFKHGVQLTVRGSYLDLLQYLADIEQLPTQMLWGQMDMRVTQHPEVVLTVNLYTLSLDKIWLKI